ncbi:MAG: sigma-54 interaction domain-containing protein [Terriglobales bacterium]
MSIACAGVPSHGLSKARLAVVTTPLEPHQRLGLDRWLIACSPAMLAIGVRAQQLAQFNLAVLLLGESGAGKEAVAHMIHDCSPRRHQPFLKVNCAALPHDLLESELFGYDAGAFTGALRSKPGYFERCEKGTLFLDEIGELPLPLQAKLLHALQDGRFTRLGGRQEICADIRILAATNVNLQQAMAAHRFREDLFFRLSVFSLHLPPLRDRPEDVPVLLEHFLQRYAEELHCPPRPCTPQLQERCRQYRWPGNVRELENFVKRYLVFGEQAWTDCNGGASVTAAAPIAAMAAANDAPTEGLKELVHRVCRDVERQTITHALEQAHWNRTLAARALNISYRALLNKVRLYHLCPGAAEARPSSGS